MRTPLRFGLVAVLTVGLAAHAPAQPAAPAKPAAPPAAATTKLKVILPQENAKLTIQNQATMATGTSREFDVPATDPAKRYEYDLKAVWEPNNYTVITRSRTVEFQGGANVTVDLTKEEPTDKAVIRFVPTPDDIVAEMVKLAGVTKDDVVYEPGCGDARITVAAVKAGAKKGVGIDLDPARVAEAKEVVKKAGVEGKVEIRTGDALDIKDLGEATVVFLYMGDEFDALIRPLLWKQLKVGSRVVSHRFTMGDWKPDKTIIVTGDDKDEYELHLWTVTEAQKKRAAAGEKK